MRMKILFYGFRHAHINTLYQKAARSDAFTIVDCIEEDAAAREAAQRQLGARFSGKDYAAWLDGDVDVVAVGTAYGERGHAVIRALSAGKHVIADKPICTSPEELETIRTLAAEHGRTVAAMLDLRYLSQSIRAAEIIRSGELGAVRNVAFNGQHCIDYARRPAWYFAPGMHGGTINDLAIHGIDLVRMISGLEITQVDAARVWNAYADRHPVFCDSAIFMARLQNGAGLLADVSYSAPTQVFSMPTYWEFRFWCEKGLLTFAYAEKTVTVYREGQAEPTVIACGADERDYLDEFLAEVASGSGAMTQNICQSTACALHIQGIADGAR